VAATDEEAIHASALRIISIRPHSSFELRRKLRMKGGDTATVDRIVERLVEVDLINDERFARDYLEYAFLRKSWGKRKVRAGLMERGIDRTIVEELLGSPDATRMEEEGARAFIEKETRGKELTGEQMKRLMSKLAARGFGWDTVTQVVRDYPGSG
jgi:regulatory protein